LTGKRASGSSKRLLKCLEEWNETKSWKHGFLLESSSFTEGMEAETENIIYKRMGDEQMAGKEPMNDAVDHMKKIEGMPDAANVRSLPKQIKIMKYVIIGFFIVSIAAVIIMSFFN
jgi:hypothetical protein